jgi:putative flippase GtrA
MGIDAEKLARELHPKGRLYTQISNFVAVGDTNTVVSFIAYTALLGVGVIYWLAGALAFGLGAINGYLLNRRWTFRVPDSWHARSRYLVVQLGGLGATTGLLWLLVSRGHLPRIPAYAITIPTVTLATFAGTRSWAFRASK